MITKQFSRPSVKMALSDELLMKVEQPARYLGNEVNAANKDKSKAEAYTGLANIYVAQDDLDSAESVYLNALETQPSNVNLYKAAVKFYEKTELARQIRTGYQQVFDRLKTEEHILIVDGSGRPDQVEARIWSALQEYFESGVDEEIAQP